MKIALAILLSAALATGTNVKLRDVISVGDQPGDLLEHVLPQVSWEELRDIALDKGGLESGHVEADVTEYAKKIVANVGQFIIRSGLDPFALSETTIKLFPVGTLELYDGWLQDLSTMSLSDSVIMRYTIDTDILELSLPLAFDTLLITYDYHTKLPLISIKGSAVAQVKHVKLNLHMGFNFSSYHAFVDKADVKDSGTITVKFTGLGLLDWIIDLMSGVVITFLHGIILSIVNLIIESPVESIVDSINEFIDTILHPNSTSYVY